MTSEESERCSIINQNLTERKYLRLNSTNYKYFMSLPIFSKALRTFFRYDWFPNH